MGKEQLLSPSNYFQKWRNYWYSVPKHHWTPILRNRKPQFNFMFTANIQIRYHLHTESIGGSINSFSQSNQFTGLSPPLLSTLAHSINLLKPMRCHTHTQFDIYHRNNNFAYIFGLFVPKSKEISIKLC